MDVHEQCDGRRSFVRARVEVGRVWPGDPRFGVGRHTRNFDGENVKSRNRSDIAVVGI